MSRMPISYGLTGRAAGAWIGHAPEAGGVGDRLIRAVRAVAAVPVRGYLHAYHGLEIDGRENLPRDGRSFVIVANHCSHLDALCLLAALPLGWVNRAYPAAARDYFCENLWRVAGAAVFVNAIPIGRDRDARRGLGVCRHLLSEPGNVLILFPEGTRSRDGRLGEFKPGVGRLVAGTGVTVLPCGVTGTFDALPKGGRWPRPRRLGLRIGVPRKFEHVGTGREDVRHVSAELRRAVEELL